MEAVQHVRNQNERGRNDAGKERRRVQREMYRLTGWRGVRRCCVRKTVHRT